MQYKLGDIDPRHPQCLAMPPCSTGLPISRTLSKSDRVLPLPQDARDHRFLARSTALATVGARASGLGLAAHTTTGGAELRGHPRPGTEHTLQQSWNVHVCVELGPVQAEPRRADFHVGQVLGWSGG